MFPCCGADIDRTGEGAATGEAFVCADGRSAQLDATLDERFANLSHPSFVIVQPPPIVIAGINVREVGEDLPSSDRVGPDDVCHCLKVVLEPPHVGQGLGVKKDPLVMAQRFSHPAGFLHDLDREGTPLRKDGERRQNEHRGIAAQEHLLQEVLDGVAITRIGLATVLLRKPRPEVLAVEHGIQVVFEQVPLDVEDELLSSEGVMSRSRLGGCFGRNRVRPSGSRAGVP